MGEVNAAETKTPVASAASQEDLIEIIGMHKWYGDFHVLKDINLHARRANGSSSAARRVPENRP